MILHQVPNVPGWKVGLSPDFVKSAVCKRKKAAEKRVRY